MRDKAIFLTVDDKKFYEQLKNTMIMDDKFHGRLSKNYSDLPLSSIQKICALVWKVAETEIIGRVNHGDVLEKERKRSFLCACYWFSNEDRYRIAKYMGCTRSFICNSKNHGYYQIINSSKFGEQYIELFKQLTLACPGRLESFETDLTEFKLKKEKEQNEVDKYSGNLNSLMEQIKDNNVKILEQTNRLLESEIETLKKRIKILEGKEKEHVKPSNAVCFDCPHSRRCMIKEMGFTLCPQLMKLNKQKCHPNNRYWRSVEVLIKKETIKLN